MKKESPPTIDDLCVPLLKPSETVSKRAFDFAFNTIHLITRDPFLPLELRIRYSPRLGSCYRFLLFHIVYIVLPRPVRCAIAPEITALITVVRLDLHPSVSVWSLTAEIFHGRRQVWSRESFFCLCYYSSENNWRERRRIIVTQKRTCLLSWSQFVAPRYMNYFHLFSVI